MHNLISSITSKAFHRLILSLPENSVIPPGVEQVDEALLSLSRRLPHVDVEVYKCVHSTRVPTTEFPVDMIAFGRFIPLIASSEEIARLFPRFVAERVSANVATAA